MREKDRKNELSMLRGKDKPVDMKFYSLGKGKSDRRMEPFYVELLPESAREKQLSSHEGEEFIVVQNGRFPHLKRMLFRPREIEEVLYGIDGIVDVQVAGVPSKKYGEEAGAFVIKKAGLDLTAEDIRDYCREKISRFKIPKHVAFVDSYLMTASGKVQRIELKCRGLLYQIRVPSHSRTCASASSHSSP